MNFEDFNLNRQLLNAIADAGYEVPSPIQEQAIPLVLQGHDVLGIAQTGTGKTAAYVLPLLMRIKYAQGMHPRALILAPTRELVMQIGKALGELAKYTDLRHIAIYGGLGPKTQIEALQKGVDIVVATPGRFLDLYLRGEIVVKQLTTLVMDEADKMMDMGFMPQINRILEVIPRKRQNLLFSATFPEKVERLSENFLEGPIRVEVTPQATTATRVHQIIYEVPNFRTKINLLELLVQDAAIFERGMVFVRSRENAENIYKFLKRKVVTEDEVRVIHANKGQNTRINAMEAFKEGKVRILIATDVAARGIDVTQVSHVVNFDVPLIYEDYVHRIGRTGRANQEGNAITFVTIADDYHIAKIEKIIRMTIPREPLPEALEVPETPFEEQQNLLRELDDQRRKDDPTFKGAFHEKKNKKVVHSKPKNEKPQKRGSAPSRNSFKKRKK
ncbi:DEAD/DEAH box helicase [Runella slithyformis]|uniref:DEAD/DEAH box helicase domain protein n=1 Tax=Runella slithyformis (strain ATCC 29530 / DSM 19594 / LMG 11500 / NCIMB 11436 / LSU 4) TaxID=761193 RepID=A0A7U3ZLA7_RUNSL|nr:DEAD/DEAH box helicase [Runella slithyformis]AEI49305.1 DEAD/DEAH box helicase domain protein [Runella slithyformis DSM 19594]